MNCYILNSKASVFVWQMGDFNISFSVLDRWHRTKPYSDRDTSNNTFKQDEYDIEEYITVKREKSL